jgi:hypothetical protein
MRREHFLAGLQRGPLVGRDGASQSIDAQNLRVRQVPIELSAETSRALRQQIVLSQRCEPVTSPGKFEEAQRNADCEQPFGRTPRQPGCHTYFN